MTSILVIGCGYMGAEYSKVLDDLSIESFFVGNSAQGVQEFHTKTGKHAFTGGLEDYLDQDHEIDFDAAIIATNINYLKAHTTLLIKKGIRKILVEKPVALDIEDLEELNSTAKKYGSEIFVAYNRRFYTSTQYLKYELGIYKKNVLGVAEITEFEHLIRKSDEPDLVKQKWMIANTSHVLDMMFFLLDYPNDLKSFSANPVTWHKSSIFSGSGKTESNNLLTYHGFWGSTGRWGLDIYLEDRFYSFKPLEKLYITDAPSRERTLVTLDYSDDEQFKPGLKKMINDFTLTKPKDLPTISDQIRLSKIIYQIAGYE